MPIHTRPRRSTHRRIVRSTCACVALVIVPSAMRAQQIDIGAAIGDALGKAMSNAVANMEAHRVAVSPAIVTIDPKTLTASVELQNHSSDTLDAELTVGDTPPVRGIGVSRAGDSTAKGKQESASPLLADDSQKSGTADSAAAGSKVASTSLAPWVTGLPSHVRLAPGEKKTITMKLNVPASRAAGEYSAWLVATTRLAETSSTAKDAKGNQAQFKFNGGGRLQGGARLVYKAE